MLTHISEPDRPPVEMFEFVQDLILLDHCGRQQRQLPRYPLVTQVSAAPIDGDFRPIGAPFIALTRNISTRGMSLVHTARIHAPWLRLKIEGKAAFLHAKVLRCRRLATYFEIGCEFVSRIDY